MKLRIWFSNYYGELFHGWYKLQLKWNVVLILSKLIICADYKITLLPNATITMDNKKYI